MKALEEELKEELGVHAFIERIRKQDELIAAMGEKNAMLEEQRDKLHALSTSLLRRHEAVARKLEAERVARAAQVAEAATLEGQLKTAAALARTAGERFCQTDASRIRRSVVAPLDAEYTHSGFLDGFKSTDFPGLFVFVTFLSTFVLTIRPEVVNTISFYNALATSVAAVISLAIPNWFWTFACVAVFLVKIRTGSRWGTDAVAAILPGSPRYTTLVRWMGSFARTAKVDMAIIRTKEDLLFQYDNWGRYVIRTARAGFAYSQSPAVITVVEAFIFQGSFLQTDVLLAPGNWEIKLATLAVTGASAFYLIGLDLSAVTQEGKDYAHSQFCFVQQAEPLVRGSETVARPLRRPASSGPLTYSCPLCEMRSELPAVGTLPKAQNICPGCDAARPSRSAFQKLQLVFTEWRKKKEDTSTVQADVRFRSFSVPHVGYATAESPPSVHASPATRPRALRPRGPHRVDTQDQSDGTSRWTLPALPLPPSRSANIQFIRERWVVV